MFCICAAVTGHDLPKARELPPSRVERNRVSEGPHEASSDFYEDTPT